jgi:hypothetical protein
MMSHYTTRGRLSILKPKRCQVRSFKFALDTINNKGFVPLCQYTHLTTQQL